MSESQKTTPDLAGIGRLAVEEYFAEKAYSDYVGCNRPSDAIKTDANCVINLSSLKLLARLKRQDASCFISPTPIPMKSPNSPTYRFEDLTYFPFRDACEWRSVVIGRTLRLTWQEATELCPLIVLREMDRRALETARREHWDAQGEINKEARWRDQT